MPGEFTPAPGLDLMEVPHDEGQNIGKDLWQGADKILGVHVVRGVNFVSGIANSLDHKLGRD